VADAPTCGTGLAEHSHLPVKLGDLMASVASNLEAHLAALDLSDEAAVQEQHAYMNLIEAHRRISDHLRSVGAAMAGYRDLPMGRHDEARLSSAQIVEAFREMIRLEEETTALLQSRLEEHRVMLAAVQGD
jgi:hypothetical protein